MKNPSRCAIVCCVGGSNIAIAFQEDTCVEVLQLTRTNVDKFRVFQRYHLHYRLWSVALTRLRGGDNAVALKLRAQTRTCKGHGATIYCEAHVLTAMSVWLRCVGM